MELPEEEWGCRSLGGVCVRQLLGSLSSEKTGMRKRQGIISTVEGGSSAQAQLTSCAAWGRDKH